MVDNSARDVGTAVAQRTAHASEGTLDMKNLTAALLLSGATFVSLSSAETRAPAASAQEPRPAGAAAPTTSPDHQRRDQDRYSVSAWGDTFSRAPGITAEGPSYSPRMYRP